MDRVIHISSFVEKTVTLANTRVIFFFNFFEKRVCKKVLILYHITITKRNKQMNYDNIDQAAAELASFIIPGTSEQIPYKVQQYVQNQYNLSDYEMSVVLDGYYDEEGYVR